MGRFREGHGLLGVTQQVSGWWKVGQPLARLGVVRMALQWAEGCLSLPLWE